jgi:hypothetical protein
VIVPGNSVPTWCGPKTDEMHYIDVYGCTSGATITLRIISPGTYNVPGYATFACDASASTVQAAYGASSNAAVPYAVHVDKSDVTAPSGITGVAAGTTGTRFTIGYWDPAAIMTNWWEPVVDSKSSGLTVVVSTKQEGGYANAVAKSTSTPNKPSVLQQVMSLFISTSVAANTAIGLTWTDSTGAVQTASVTTTVAGTITSSDLVTAINNVASLTTSTGVSSASSTATAHGSTWNEYRITFAPSSTTTYFKSSLAVSSALTTSQAFVTTYTNYNNYPWFYDFSYGYSGSGRFVVISSSIPVLITYFILSTDGTIDNSPETAQVHVLHEAAELSALAVLHRSR